MPYLTWSDSDILDTVMTKLTCQYGIYYIVPGMNFGTFYAT